MFGLDILDVAIGTALVYMLLCLLLAAFREGLESITKTKGTDLEKGISELLSYPALVQSFYAHPFISALYRGAYVSGGANLPSYIPARNFALTIMDLAGMSAAGAKATTWTVDDLRTASGSWAYQNIQPVLRIALQHSAGDLTVVQAEIEAWYNSAMQRVSGWYKRRTQVILFVAGLVMTAALNVNTLAIVQALKESSALRDIAVAQAQGQVKQAGQAHAPSAADIQGIVKQLDLPIGWDANAISVIDKWFTDAPATDSKNEWLAKLQSWHVGAIAQLVGGWLMTAIALTLGAPFWFDVLSKLVQLRGSVEPANEKPPTKSAPEKAPSS
jgi:hypothetical protein